MDPNVVRGAIIGGVFVVTLLVAGFVTVPKERRQQHNRLLAKSQEAVLRELEAVVRARLHDSGEHQLRAVRGHLGAEADRWKAQTSRVATGEMRMPMMSSGFTPDNRAKLEVEWPRAIEARLEKLAPATKTVVMKETQDRAAQATKGSTKLIG
jgi:hypothetical protein